MGKNEMDQTLVLIKPDALRNSLTGYVLSLLSELHTGLRFAGAKVVHVTKMLAEEHYAEHRDKVFFPSLIEYITGRIHYAKEPEKRRVIAIVYQGAGAAQMVRKVAGPTNPHEARDERPGCIRSLGTVVPLKNEKGEDIGRRMDNLVHGSATPEEAEREIKLWFMPHDIPPHMRIYETVKSDGFYYYKDGKLLTNHEADCFCLTTPGDLVWKTDLEALQLIKQGKPAPCTLETVAAKYLVNVVEED